MNHYEAKVKFVGEYLETHSIADEMDRIEANEKRQREMDRIEAELRFNAAMSYLDMGAKEVEVDMYHNYAPDDTEEKGQRFWEYRFVQIEGQWYQARIIATNPKLHHSNRRHHILLANTEHGNVIVYSPYAG